MDKLSKILFRWEIMYDVLKNKWKDGRHYADDEQMRTGFIELYEHVAQLEAEKQWVIDLCKDPNYRTRYTLKQACEFLDFIIAKLEEGNDGAK